MHSIKKLATFSDFETLQVFFRKQHIYFPEKFPNFERFETFHFSTRNPLLHFDEKNSRSDVNKTADVRVNSIGKHWVKERTHLRGRFCLHLSNMAQNNNYSVGCSILIIKYFFCHQTKMFWF